MEAIQQLLKNKPFVDSLEKLLKAKKKQIKAECDARDAQHWLDSGAITYEAWMTVHHEKLQADVDFEKAEVVFSNGLSESCQEE